MSNINRMIYCKSCNNALSGCLPVLKGTSCKYCGVDIYKNWGYKPKKVI